MQIKVCGLKYTGNIEDIVRLKPEYIGFIFYRGSLRYAGGRRKLKTYISKLSSVKKVGVFVNTTVEDIRATVEAYDLDMVQLHGKESAAFCRILNKDIPVIKAFQVQEQFDFSKLKEYEDSCSLFLFDKATNSYGGSGIAFDWQLLEQYTLNKPFLLSGGIGPENIKKVRNIKHPAMVGIDVNSRLETSAGLKSIRKVKLVLHEIRNR